jgi:hypothetical protein
VSGTRHSGHSGLLAHRRTPSEGLAAAEAPTSDVLSGRPDLGTRKSIQRAELVENGAASSRRR